VATSLPTFKPSSVSISGLGAKYKDIVNVSVPTSGVEVNQVLQSNINGIVLRCRELAEIRLAFTLNGTANKYITLKAGAVLALENLNWATSTVYILSNTDGVTVEILQTYS